MKSSEAMIFAVMNPGYHLANDFLEMSPKARARCGWRLPSHWKEMPWLRFHVPMLWESNGQTKPKDLLISLLPLNMKYLSSLR